MANCETTYYTLLNKVAYTEMKYLANTMNEEAFVSLGFAKKYFHHLWIEPNNEAFLDVIGQQVNLKKIESFLLEQLNQYISKTENDSIQAMNDWLEQTVFICQNEYNKTKNEVYKYAVDWCKSYVVSIDQKSVELPLPSKKLVVFSNSETITDIHVLLKVHFNSEDSKNLLKALQGEKLDTPILFTDNSNKFVEVFRRLKYNGFISSSWKEIQTWIVTNFCYQYSLGNKLETRAFNPNTVHDILTKGKCEPSKKSRLLKNLDWLPHKSFS